MDDKKQSTWVTAFSICKIWLFIVSFHGFDDEFSESTNTVTKYLHITATVGLWGNFTNYVWK